MKVGFTGTREGMTDRQRFRLCCLMKERFPFELHHGDCVGADAEAHAAFLAFRIQEPAPDAKLIIHPPMNGTGRAYCEGDEYRELKPYLERNHDIVDETDVLIAAPRHDAEEMRSGTWATIRYARKQGKPITIIYADGTFEDEQPSNDKDAEGAS